MRRPQRDGDICGKDGEAAVSVFGPSIIALALAANWILQLVLCWTALGLLRVAGRKGGRGKRGAHLVGQRGLWERQGRMHTVVSLQNEGKGKDETTSVGEVISFDRRTDHHKIRLSNGHVVSGAEINHWVWCT